MLKKSLHRTTRMLMDNTWVCSNLLQPVLKVCFHLLRTPGTAGVNSQTLLTSGDAS